MSISVFVVLTIFFLMYCGVWRKAEEKYNLLTGSFSNDIWWMLAKFGIMIALMRVTGYSDQINVWLGLK